MTYRIGWFTTARDQAALQLFNAVHDGIKNREINGEIAFVFSNRELKESPQSDILFGAVQNAEIPLVCCSSQEFQPEMHLAAKKDDALLKKWRMQFDREIIARIKEFKPDIIILAGYMLIVGPEICRRFNMINLHPAVPGGPTGTWQEVIWKLIEDKQGETGAMMHLVTEELDKGPPITYYTFPIKGGQFDNLWKDLEEKLRSKNLPQIIIEEGENNPLFALIREEGVKREIPLVYSTVREFAGSRISIENSLVVADGQVVHGGYCLNNEIEECLQGKNG